MNDRTKEETNELERLAKIGKAAECALKKGIFIYDIVMTHEGVLFEYSEINNVHDLLEFAESEDK